MTRRGAVSLSEPVDGFRLAFDRAGRGSAVVLLHGWPGNRTDYDGVVPLLYERAEVVVPDLRGFGESTLAGDIAQYSAKAQARSVAGLIEQLGLDRPVVAGYDIGSRIAQSLAADRPDLVRALVLTPPLPGIGDRILTPAAMAEFWYQSFHQLDLAQRLVDGRSDAVRAYLSHFWDHWSGPECTPTEARLDALTEQYARPGAFAASIGWYRAGAGTLAASVQERPPRPGDRLTIPTTVLWPEHDPLFPRDWADRLDEFLADVTLRTIDAGHFVPVEAPTEFAEAILNVIDTDR